MNEKIQKSNCEVELLHNNQILDLEKREGYYVRSGKEQRIEIWSRKQ